MTIYPVPSQISLGEIRFSFYGLLLGIGFVVVMLYLERANLKGIKTTDYILGGFAAVVGAKLLYLLHNLTQFVDDPVKYLSRGGFALFGAIGAVLISVGIISKLRALPYFKISDTLFSIFPLAQAIGRFGNYFNQELYGRPTDQRWGLFVDEQFRLNGYEQYQLFHPTFLYEAVLSIVLFLVLVIAGRYYRAKGGMLTAIFFVGYGLIRLILNRFRIDKVLLFGVETSDIYATLFLLTGIVIILLIQQKPSLIRIDGN